MIKQKAQPITVIKDLQNYRCTKTMVSISSRTSKIERITERPDPIHQESPFSFEELFFSITDSSSAIQFANDVFLRVAKYSTEELMGQFHHVIRHPDMPKSAFKIMWEYLKRKESVAVYVKNLAKDGSYYWVTALVFPIKDGYLSIRLKPSSPIFDIVKIIYKKVLAKEKELLNKWDKEHAIIKSKEYLLELIRAQGFKDYSHFMHYSLLQELHYRYDKANKASNGFQNEEVINDLDQQLIQVDQILTDLVEFSHQLNKLHVELYDHSNFLIDLSMNIGGIAQNARLQSAKLDSSDQSLFVISEKMGEQTRAGTTQLTELLSAVAELENKFQEMSFDIISSKLQVEMTKYYNREIDSDSSNLGQFLNKNEAMNLLNESFRPHLERLVKSVTIIKTKKRNVLNGIIEIERFLTVLRFILVTGKVEMPRLVRNKDVFEDIFGNLAAQISQADNHLHKLRNVILDNRYLFEDYDRQNARLQKVFNSLNQIR